LFKSYRSQPAIFRDDFFYSTSIFKYPQIIGKKLQDARISAHAGCRHLTGLPDDHSPAMRSGGNDLLYTWETGTPFVDFAKKVSVALPQTRSKTS
jgi:hypothetical protein